MAAPTIISVSPASGSTSISVNSTISVIFDQEVDLYRLKNGGIFIEGPDQSKSIGPGFLDIEASTDEDDLLSSPGYKGIVEASFTFERVDGSGESVSYYDYGSGSLAGQIYRTKVILTPKKPFASLTEYTVYIIGDEDTSDSYDFGLSTRTVFDPQKGANLGNGEIIFSGGFTGSQRQQFFVEITTGGTVGTTEYEWWTSIDTVHQVGVSSIASRILRDGVSLSFSQGLVFEVGDTFTVWCDVPLFMDGSSEFSFTTSDQTFTEIPASSTFLSGSGSTTSSSTASFSVSSTSPEDREALVDPETTSYTVTFDDDLDSSTITDDSVTISSLAADGDPSGTFTGEMTKTLTVSGSILTITPDADQVFENNIVTIVLDSSISNTDGTTLSSDYEFFFGTTYTPFYAGIRNVRLRLGSAGNYFPDETVAIAIWDASRLALAYIPSTIYDNTVLTAARRQFVICYAAWILITAGSGASGTGSTRIRLSDFDVSKAEGSGSSKGLDDSLKDCWERNLEVLQNGGDIDGTVLSEIQEPKLVVKGSRAVDEPHYGRLWEIPSVPIANARVKYFHHRRWYRTNIKKG
jgi:hypothetical protein